MKDLKETTWNHSQGESEGTFYTAERKWINKIHKWKEKYPDDVEICYVNQDGSMVVHLPVSWCKISPKKRVNMTQEQKDRAKERLAKTRINQTTTLKSKKIEGNS